MSMPNPMPAERCKRCKGWDDRLQNCNFGLSCSAWTQGLLNTCLCSEHDESCNECLIVQEKLKKNNPSPHPSDSSAPRGGEEVEKLHEQIKSMRNCQNCKHFEFGFCGPGHEGLCNDDFKMWEF